MKVECIGDQKAQILSGVEPWERGTVEIDLVPLEQDVRQDLADGGKALGLVRLAAEDALANIRARIAEAKRKQAEKAKEREAEMELIRVQIETSQPRQREREELVYGLLVRYPTYEVPWISTVYPMPDDLAAARAQKLAQLGEEARIKTEQAKIAAFAKAQPQIEAARLALEAKEKAEAEAKAEVLAAKCRRRQEIGGVEIDISRGDRDWGTPWGAVVTVCRGKDQYDFDCGSYDLGTATLTIRCKPGDVIAWGQKNFRKPKKTIHERRRITDNWKMEAMA